MRCASRRGAGRNGAGRKGSDGHDHGNGCCGGQATRDEMTAVWAHHQGNAADPAILRAISTGSPPVPITVGGGGQQGTIPGRCPGDARRRPPTRTLGPMVFYGHSAGHGSWIFLVVIAVGIALRMLSSRRRGSMGGSMRTRPGPPSGMSFQSQPDPASPPARPRTGPTYTGVPAGWMADPSGKHDERYWSGTEWTEHVMNDGTPAIDPLPNRAAPRGGGPSGPSDGPTESSSPEGQSDPTEGPEH